jgi:hypothetical protein
MTADEELRGQHSTVGLVQCRPNMFLWSGLVAEIQVKHEIGWLLVKIT